MKSFIKILPAILFLHEFSPSDKTRIIKAWQASGAVVTVTGDSVQDGEALSAADVGCAVGKFGADVAKGNADIIIKNNRFNSVDKRGKGKAEGCLTILKNGLLPCFRNFGELISVFIGMLMFSKMPVSAVQLLWINLLTDSAPAISLSMENAEKTVMNRKQDSALGKIFGGTAYIFILLQSIFIAAMTLTAFAIGNKSGSARLCQWRSACSECRRYSIATTINRQDLF